MICGLSKYKVEIKTHYVGVTGKEYSVEEFGNFGGGIIKRGKKDLPSNEYPYSIKYKFEYRFKICRECKCKNKE